MLRALHCCCDKAVARSLNQGLRHGPGFLQMGVIVGSHKHRQEQWLRARRLKRQWCKGGM